MNQFQVLEKKIFTTASFYHQFNIWQFFEQKIVFTNGCFDILHFGHIDYLSKAADLGDKLVIGLNSDTSVTKLKGSNRPLQNQQSRSTILASLAFVDAVIVFDEQTPENLIEFIKPNVLVKGGDYEIDQIVGANFVKNLGGQVITIPFVEGYSTTAIENKIKRST